MQRGFSAFSSVWRQWRLGELHALLVAQEMGAYMTSGTERLARNRKTGPTWEDIPAGCGTSLLTRNLHSFVYPHTEVGLVNGPDEYVQSACVAFDERNDKFLRNNVFTPVYSSIIFVPS